MLSRGGTIKETNLDDVISSPTTKSSPSQISFAHNNLKSFLNINDTKTPNANLLSPIPTQVQRQWSHQAAEHAGEQHNYKSRETRRNSTIIDRRRVSLVGGNLNILGVGSAKVGVMSEEHQAQQHHPRQFTLESVNDECRDDLREYLKYLADIFVF